MSGHVAAEVQIMARLAGVWRLVAIELPQADGTVRRPDVTGLLVLSAEGHMAVQVRTLETSAVDSAYSSGGYEASYGTIILDAATSTFVYRVEGALVRDLIGQDFPRAFRFVDGQLVLTSTRDGEAWRVVWRRAQQCRQRLAGGDQGAER